MNRIFEPRGYFNVPDGTEISAFLNATDGSQRDVPWGILGEMSIAAGRIGPGISSGIHVHPVVTQITYLVLGKLVVRMKDTNVSNPYDLELRPGTAVLCEPGTLFQLRNAGDQVAQVLYIVSPSYVFEMTDDEVVYDDAIVVSETWEEIEAKHYRVPALESPRYEAVAARAESLRRQAVRKGNKPPPLAREEIRPLQAKYDHLAPDGSEIRLLAAGTNGGLAHCVLPAGKISAPVRHHTVEELWYVLEGDGELWRSRDSEERVDLLQPGDSARIPVGTSFQFRAGQRDLRLILATMPPWPCTQEAVPVDGKWPARVLR